MSAPAQIDELELQQYRQASQQLSGARAASAPVEAEIRLSFGHLGEANPIAASATGTRGGANMYGACSIQNFAASTGAGSLSHTNADASGWINYVNQFTPRNFWFSDAGVSTWEYLDPWDDWQDTYGLDAVRAFYHSGHGGMDSNGVFFAPLGSDWSTRGAWARSDQMSFANQHGRYIFFSTCFSCRVLDGQSPIRTWNNANNGLRMLFGYETTSVDADNYGSAFWKHWNQGKSFSQAWLDASWYDISHQQAPSAFACGSDSGDATNRLYNERLFYGDAVPKNWYQWRWYYAAASALARRQASRNLPNRLAMAHLEPRTATPARVRELFNRLPLGMAMPREINARPSGAFVVGENHLRIAIERDGSFDASFAEANRDNRNAPGIQAGIAAASEFVRQLGLDHEGVQFDRVFHKWECGGSPAGSGTLETPRIVETVVQYTQVINGLPVVSPSQGKVTVTLDNDLRVNGVVDTTRPVAGLVDQSPMVPPAPGQAESAAPRSGLDPENLLANAWRQRMKMFVINGTMPRAFGTVPGSFDVGYSIRENTAVLVVRHEVEVDFGQGLLKRYVVEEPIIG
jgi:hypothetical protein